MSGPGARPRLLAVASGGGHFHQLAALAPAFAGYEVTWATTLPGLAEEAGLGAGRLIPDCNRNEPLAIFRALWAIRRTVRALKPDAVVSTGALPGLIALWAGRRLGARTVWVDSVANAEAMSMSGRLAARVADLRLSQWPDVAAAEGAEYAGSVL
ncbi:MAG: glycosyltransferase [Paracoccaceae bacterium]|nr:glycosyltransferase [Paracoccaceae bacterium]